MLKQMREGAKSTVLKLILFGLLLLAMAGLALMDVQGMFRSGVSNTTVASYGGQKLSAAAFDHLVQNALRDQHMKQSDAYRAGLPQQLLKQEIDNHLFSMAANDFGLQVSDVLAAKQAKEIIAPLMEKGMTDKMALQRVLDIYNVSEDQLVSTLKSQIASQQLLTTISLGAEAPQQLVKDALRFRHEWRSGEYFRLTSENIGAVKTPTDAELRAYYDSIAHEYALPEYRTLSVIVLDKNVLGDDAKITEEKLKQYYNDNISDYKSPETRVISQVVAPDESSAKTIFAAAAKSKDLEKAAKLSPKANFIKAGVYTEAGLPAEISKTAFTGAAGKVIAPVKSPLGWHIIYVEKVSPATVKPFASVKAEIEKDISQDKISEALYKRANQIDDEIAGGKSLSAVAKENNIKETVLEKVDVHGMDQSGKKAGAALPLYDKIIENGFSLQKGAASPLIETPDGAFVIVAAKDVFPSEQKSFDKVHDDVLARWMKDHQLKALSDKAAKIMDRLKQGEAFEKVAAELKQTVQSTGLIQRGTTALKAKVDDNLLSALFSLDKPGEATTVTNDNTITIVRLADRKIQMPKEIGKQEQDTMTALLNRSLKQDLLEQYRASLASKYDVRINDKLMSDMYTPKDDNNAANTED